MALKPELARSVWCKKHGGVFRAGATCVMPGEIPTPDYLRVAYEVGSMYGNPPQLSEIKFFGKKTDANKWVRALREILDDEGEDVDAVVLENQSGEIERWSKGE